MSIQIRQATVDDMQAVWDLIHELAVYEKEPDAVITTPESMKRDGFENDLFKVLIAEENGKTVGIALYYFGYSTWKGKMLYLDDLVVTESYRQRGIGQLLFKQLKEIAIAEDANQMRWHVLDWNTPAIKFYEKNQVHLDGEWITCKIEKPALTQDESI